MAEAETKDEIADLEWRRITNIAWPTLSIIYGIQALFAQNPITTWQILYVAGLFVIGLFCLFLSKKNLTKFSSTPTVLYLLLSPVIIGSASENSWMSIGLVTFAAVIYFSAIPNLFLAISIVFLISWYQGFIVQFNLPSISDNLDIKFFHSYFSFLWIFIMGSASIFIRRQYLQTAENIRKYVKNEMNAALSELGKLKEINEKDSRNIRLHGTVLNSLIYIRNLLQIGKEISEPFVSLIAEINALANENDIPDPRDFRIKLQEMVEGRTIKRLKVSHTAFDGRVGSKAIEDSVLEIIREFLLNTEKHTKAENVLIVVSKNNSNGIRIEIKDDSLKGMTNDSIKLNLLAPLKSKNLNRLVSSSLAKMTVSRSQRNQWRRTQIDIPFKDPQLELESTLAQSRLSGLNDFAFNFVRASAIVALLSLPGYIFIDLQKVALALIAVTVVLFYIVLQVKRNLFTISLLVFSSSLIIPSLSHDVLTCSQVASIPWLFNHILTVGFIALIFIKNRILKWIPVAILTFQSLYYPSFYPADCKNIFLGSLPGIPLIIFFALAVVRLRRREITFDQGEALQILEIDDARNSANEYRERAYTELIMDCSQFLTIFSDKTDNSQKLDLISLQIEKIQTFLVCAEHFNSHLIRALFEIFREKQFCGMRGKLTLLGSNFHVAEESLDIGQFALEIEKIKGLLPLSLTVVSVESLELHFQGTEYGYRPSIIQKVPIIYES